MKSTNRFFIAALLLHFVSISFANTSENFRIEKLENYSFTMSIAYAKQAKIQVSIKDNYGVVLHKEVIKQHKISKQKYDLKNLDMGLYTLVVEYDHVINIQTIQKNIKNIEINNEELKCIFKPNFRQAPNYLDLNMLCLGNPELRLSIQNSEGQIIYNEVTAETAPLHKRYNISNLEPGYYTFLVSTTDNSFNIQFSELITINTDLVSR